MGIKDARVDLCEDRVFPREAFNLPHPKGQQNTTADQAKKDRKNKAHGCHPFNEKQREVPPALQKLRVVPANLEAPDIDCKEQE